MNENDLVELEIEQEGMRVSLKKAGAAGLAAPLPWLTPPGGNPGPALATPAAPPAAPKPDPNVKAILSPMVGTFYRRPSPDADPYVDVGSPLQADTVVCIVEAMKVNNEIKAEIEGEVVEVLVEDGQPVEFDQPLFKVKVD